MISIGECMVELFSEEPIEVAETFKRSMAGDSFNILVSASRLGTSTGYITKIGQDPFGDHLIKTLESENIDTHHVMSAKEGGFTAVHFVTINSEGDREFIYYRKGSAPTTMSPDELDESYIKQAKVMHCSGIAQAISESARDTVLQAAKIAKKNGVLVSYDPNYRHQLWTHEEAKVAMKQLMPYVDIFLPSSPSDCVPLFNTTDPHVAINEVEAMGVTTTVVTLGKDGALVGSGATRIHVSPITEGNIIDTTGAGDSFKGTFIHGIIEGMSVHDSAILGSISAGITVTGRGAISAMPHREKVYSLFKDQKRKPQ